MYKLKVVKIGTNLALILDDENCAGLGLKEGDCVDLTESTDGYRIVGQQRRTQRHMAVARGVVAKRRALLRRLGD